MRLTRARIVVAAFVNLSFDELSEMAAQAERRDSAHQFGAREEAERAWGRRNPGARQSRRRGGTSALRPGRAG